MKTDRSVPSLKDIAAVAGVSIMTVSNVLRPKAAGGRTLFTKQTERRVQRAVEKLGYVPNRAARAMRTHKTGVVGFVAANFAEDTGTVENFGVHPFLVGLNHVLAPTGRHVALVEMKEFEMQKSERLPVALRENFFDALVVHHGLSTRVLHLLEQYKIPMIHWDSGVFNPENCVYRDELMVGHLATQRLLELGHRQIAFAGGSRNWRNYQAGRPVHFSFAGRFEGYVRAMKEKKLRPVVLRDYDARGLSNQIQREKITGIVAQIAYLPLVRAAALSGKRIPEDISLLACDLETSVADRGDVPGGVSYNRYEAGRTAGELMIKRLESGGAPVPSISLPIIVKDGITTAPVPRLHNI